MVFCIASLDSVIGVLFIYSNRFLVININERDSKLWLKHPIIARQKEVQQNGYA